LHNLKTAEAASQRPFVQATLAPYDHITYKKSSIAAFLKFWDEVTSYEQRHGTTLPVTTMIDGPIRERLISNDRRNLDNGQFYSQSHAELYDAMQAEFRPIDRLDFMKQLENNVEFVFTAHYKVTPEYYRPLYDALLLYISKFTKIYEILIHGIRNDMTILPRCDNKPGGLVKAFVNKIPFEHGARLLQLLDTQKWDSLHAFLRDFRRLIDDNKEDSERARKLRRTFGGTQYESQKFEQKLQQLQELRALPVDPAVEEDEWHEAVNTAALDLENELDTMLNALQQPHGKEPFKKTPHDKNAAPRDPLVCITKLLHGTCTKTPCNYSHKEELVTKKRYEFIELMQKQLAASKTSGPPRAFPPQRVSVMEDIYDEDY